MGVFLLGSDARRVVSLAAGAHLAKARALVGHDTGVTAASGRLVQASRGGVHNDRVMVVVAFDGASVQQQWGHRGQATRFLTRAFE